MYSLFSIRRRYEQENKKYITDFMAFLKESNIEDFCHVESGTVFVSTIHKSKGREFDNV